MKLTNNGMDVFASEFNGIPRKKVHSPFRRDSDPSFQIKQSKSGIWCGKDYGGNQFYGNAISFIQEKYALSFGEAMQKIIEDLGLREKSRTYSLQKIEHVPVEKSIPYIEFTDKPFDSKHAAYWNQYHLSEAFLRENHVYQVDKWAMNKKIQPKIDGELTFCYFAPDISRSKILRINVPPEDKWRSGMPNSYLWNYWKYRNLKEPLNKLFTLKARKDELVFNLVGFNDTLSTQSENAKVMLELSNNVKRINKITKRNIFVMGTDPQGKQTSIEVTKSTGWEWFNIDNHHYKNDGIEDPADFVKEYGPDLLQNMLKIKYGV
jgi:hypothetical protein